MENWLHLQPLKKTPLNLGATGEIYAVLFGAIPSPRGARAGEIVKVKPKFPNFKGPRKKNPNPASWER